ncbi:hypothetical protein J1614_004454, partial [Plenodomus biglobosus]
PKEVTELHGALALLVTPQRQSPRTPCTTWPGANRHYRSHQILATFPAGRSRLVLTARALASVREEFWQSGVCS